ncbi:MAG TPA: membrane protein insertase YidC [Ornithinibacter sp.]|nr:membrane protein insertase YidC [Ornithinibacter sp.]
MSPLAPFKHALAAVLAAAHDGLTALGADPAAGGTWLLCVAAVVVTLRLALLPVVVHGVRQAHAAARARPHLQELSTRLGSRPDRDSLRRHLEERRKVSAEHGVSRLGCLPLLLQMPVWLALYHLISDVASGTAVGAMGPGLVSSLSAASIMGVTLAGSGYVGSGPAHLAVVAGLAVTAASLSYVTQRYVVASNMSTEGLPEAMATAQRVMPALSAVGMVVAGGVVPVALLAYWVCNSAWTLGQSAAIAHWFPTPGTSAYARRSC